TAHSAVFYLLSIWITLFLFRQRIDNDRNCTIASDIACRTEAIHSDIQGNHQGLIFQIETQHRRNNTDSGHDSSSWDTWSCDLTAHSAVFYLLSIWITLFLFRQRIDNDRNCTIASDIACRTEAIHSDIQGNHQGLIFQIETQHRRNNTDSGHDSSSWDTWSCD